MGGSVSNLSMRLAVKEGVNGSERVDLRASSKTINASSKVFNVSSSFS